MQDFEVRDRRIMHQVEEQMTEEKAKAIRRERIMASLPRVDSVVLMNGIAYKVKKILNRNRFVVQPIF